MGEGDLCVCTQLSRGCTAQPGTAHQQRVSSDFGLFGSFFLLLTVLCLQTQPQHPTACALDHALGFHQPLLSPKPPEILTGW